MFKGFAKTSLFMSLLCFTAAGYAKSYKSPIPVRQQEETCGRGFKHMRISARHIEGKGIGYDQGYSTLETFLAPDQETFSVMPFMDLRGHVFDNGKWAANGGLGVRWRWGCRAYGANAYYDYRNSKKNYNQVGVGLESLGEIWDFRINGYLPIGSKVSRPYRTRFSHFSGNHMILSRKYETAMKGADAEAGGHFYYRDFDFFAGAGPYYFDGEIGPHAWGGKARLFGMWKEYIGLQVSYSYDNVFRSIVQGEVTFSLPLGPRPKVKADRKNCKTTCLAAERLDRRMVQPVVRDEIIVLNDSRKNSVAINPLTGEPYVFFFVDNTSHSAGTFKSPFNTLADAQNASGLGDVIYIFPGDMTSTGMSSGITLQNGQQLLGATTSHKIATTAGTVTIKPQASGNFLPLLANTAGNVVTLANNNVVSGLFIQNLNGHGIFGSAINNVTATQNFIQSSTSVGYNGIELDNATGTTSLSNNTIMNQGICVNIDNSLPVSNATYVLMNNTINNNDSDYGVSVTYTEGSNNKFMFSGNQITGSDEYGVSITCSNTAPNIAHTFVITNNTIFVGEYPVYMGLSGTACNCTIGGNSFVSGEYGVYIQSTDTAPNIAHTFVISNNQMQVAEYPVYLELTDTLFNCAVSGNSMVSGEQGFEFDLYGASQVSLTIADNLITGLYSLGYLYINNTSTLSANITNNTFNAYGDDESVQAQLYDTSSCTLNVSNNTFIGGYDGFYLVNASSGSPSSASLTNNSFSSSFEDGIIVYNSGSTNLGLEIVGNVFQGFGTNAVNVNQDNSAALCLELNDNSSNPFPNAYLLNQTMGIFNLQTPVGNVGQLTQTGTITPVSSCQ
jgi:hypothetical protein